MIAVIADDFTGAAEIGGIGLRRRLKTVIETDLVQPEDADLLIENTETGRTIALHKLKIIDTLFESTACLIGNKTDTSKTKNARIETIVQKLKAAVGEG